MTSQIGDKPQLGYKLNTPQISASNGLDKILITGVLNSYEKRFLILPENQQSCGTSLKVYNSIVEDSVEGFGEFYDCTTGLYLVSQGGWYCPEVEMTSFRDDIDYRKMRAALSLIERIMQDHGQKSVTSIDMQLTKLKREGSIINGRGMSAWSFVKEN